MNTRGWLRKRLDFRVVVHTTDDKTLEGTLVTAAADGLVLRAAVFLGVTAEDGASELPGETFIPRERVSLVQVPGARNRAYV